MQWKVRITKSQSICEWEVELTGAEEEGVKWGLKEER